MKSIIKIIFCLCAVYLFISWAADNPNGVEKLRDDMKSGTIGAYEYVKSLDDEGDKE